jgi:hypothetical protein
VVGLITALVGAASGVWVSKLKFRHEEELATEKLRHEAQLATERLRHEEALATERFRNDLKAEYDKDLRNRRIKAYRGLWCHLQVLGQYDLPKPLTPVTFEELTEGMREWYFEVGGLYLSEDSRITYFKLKKAIKDVLEKTKDRPQEVVAPKNTNSSWNWGDSYALV